MLGPEKKRGEDQWAAVTRADGGRDWVQVGNKIHLVGKSHVDDSPNGYPPWGDDASTSPPYRRSVLWMSAAEPQWAIPVWSLTWKD